jgi:hypothetical protein
MCNEYFVNAVQLALMYRSCLVHNKSKSETVRRKPNNAIFETIYGAAAFTAFRNGQRFFSFLPARLAMLKLNLQIIIVLWGTKT